MSIEVYKKA